MKTKRSYSPLWPMLGWLALVVLLWPAGCVPDPRDTHSADSARVGRYYDDSLGVVCYLWGSGPVGRTAAISCVKVHP